MNRFEKELSHGNFVVSECVRCNEVVWPSSNFCNICHNMTEWRSIDNIGTIIEFSKRNDEFFGLIEIEQNLRIMGKIISKKTPEINQKVALTKCTFDQTPKFIFEVFVN